jgi:hypothetical protein
LPLSAMPCKCPEDQTAFFNRAMRRSATSGAANDTKLSPVKAGLTDLSCRLVLDETSPAIAVIAAPHAAAPRCGAAPPSLAKSWPLTTVPPCQGTGACAWARLFRNRARLEPYQVSESTFSLRLARQRTTGLDLTKSRARPQLPTVTEGPGSCEDHLQPSDQTDRRNGPYAPRKAPDTGVDEVSHLIACRPAKAQRTSRDSLALAMVQTISLPS